MSFNKRAYNVSNVKQGEIVQRSFILKNSGAGELKLYRVSTNLDAVELEHPKQVAPSETENITVTVNTKELLGEVKVEVLVVSNDSQNTLIKLLIDLNVVQ